MVVVMASSNTKRVASKSEDDLYNTPTEALEAAWNEGLFDPFEVYYDPCNGLGKISDFLISKGKKVYTSDIVDYGCQDHVVDFLKVESIPEDVECIVFNPPFKLTEEFIDHAYYLLGNIIMFNRASVLETKSRSRKHYNGDWYLKDFYSFGNRVSCTKGAEEKPTANSVWYGWFVYTKYYIDHPAIHWLFTK